jgi:peptidyl-dipeptidase Dcp
VHYQTGQADPAGAGRQDRAASTFNQGFDDVEYLSSALVDMKLHLAGDAKIDPDAFERETLAELGMPKEIVMRHRTPQFGTSSRATATRPATTATSGRTC